MCIIIVKPSGTSLPSEFTIKVCERTNPHGFGFATPTERYHTMNAEEFNKRLKGIKKEEPCIIHCRIATHGSVKKSNCHPFYDATTGVSFAHNGVLYGIRPLGDMTDSETAFRGILVPTIKKYGYVSKELARKVADIIGSSRFAFINEEGEIQMYGKWVKQEGCFFSHPLF